MGSMLSFYQYKCINYTKYGPKTTLKKKKPHNLSACSFIKRYILFS